MTNRTERSSELPPTREAAAQLLRDNLARARRLRGVADGDSALAADRLRLREWQAGQLERTYPDLLANKRYGPAARFFLSDLYGPKDFSERDHEVERILPTLVTLLPSAGILTIATAVELDALSEELDAALLDRLRASGAPLSIEEGSYAAAYRACANRDERARQIQLVGEIGHALERLTRKPLAGAALRLMRGPAHATGLSALYEFLDRGYKAFRHMGQAGEFLDTIGRRERGLMERLFRGEPNPFALAR